MQNNRQNELIRAIIEKKLREEAQTQQLQNSSNPLDRINGISNKVGNLGEGLTNTGNFLSNKFSSMGSIGNGMQTVGNALQTGAGAVQKVIPTSSGLMNTVGSKIGSAIGSGAATSAGATAGTTAATTAGGSAASGAATAGPIGALVALGAMALQGTNRKRAKQGAEQTQQLAESQVDVAKQRLAQAGQNAEQIGNQSEVMQDNVLQNPQVLQEDYLSQFGGDTKNLIDSYIQSSMPEQNPITSYVNNSIPVVDNQPSEEQMKQGIFNKLANGLGDFLTGYKDNRENGFDPNNLLPVENKGFMQRMGEGIGTAARMIHNPIAQGVIAGGLSAALTGNPLYGLGMANKFANNKMNSDLYQQILRNQGVDFSNYNGVITSDDMSKILAANKYQKGFMTRKDYDRLRLENGMISVDEYNQSLSNPDY